MSTSVQGNLKDLAGANASGNTFLRFRLRGLNGNIPRVNGTALIPQGNGDGSAMWFYDFIPSGTGAISGTLYSTRDAAGTGNGDIEAGGSLTAVWYGMVLYVGGIAGPEIPVHAKIGATLDVTNATPISITPVITAPTGDTTYARLDGGNTPFTGAISVKTLNTVRYADQFTGADASIKINAAITEVIAAGGGMVDCRGLGGAQTMSAAIAIGSASLVPVHLILPNTCTWTWSTNLGAGVNAVSLYPKSSIIGPGSGEGNPCVLRAATGFTGNSLFSLVSVTATGDYYHPSGFNVQIQSGATCTTAGTIITGMVDISLVQSIETIVNSGATCPIGMLVIKSGAGCSLINCGVDASNNTGTTPVVCGDGTNNLDNVNFHNCSFVHPGPGLPALSITGGAFTGVLNFYGLYIELGTGYDTTTALVQIAAGVVGVQNFFGGRCDTNIALAANYFFDIGAGSRINTFGCRIFGNSDVNGINDHNKGTFTIKADANGNIAPYSSYLSPAQIAIGGGPTSSSFNNAMLALFPDSSHRGIVVSNQADALLNGLDIDAGVTAAQSRTIRFIDRNVAQWSIDVDGSNVYRVDDVPNSLLRFLLQQNNKTELNAGSGANTVQINVRTGTGTSGTAFGDGLGATRATIDGSGIITELTANGAQWVKGQASELLTLSTGGTTTDTTANLLPANSIIEAVVARVTTTITVATDWKLGDATQAARFSNANATLAAGTTQVGLNQADPTVASSNLGPVQVSAAKVRVTTTGTPGAGVIRITVFYRQFVAPTS